MDLKGAVSYILEEAVEIFKGETEEVFISSLFYAFEVCSFCKHLDVFSLKLSCVAMVAGASGGLSAGSYESLLPHRAAGGIRGHALGWSGSEERRGNDAKRLSSA